MIVFMKKTLNFLLPFLLPFLFKMIYNCFILVHNFFVVSLHKFETKNKQISKSKLVKVVGQIVLDKFLQGFLVMLDASCVT